MGMHEANRGRVLFTSNQLRELQHQALVLKYIMSGVNVPSELLNSIRNSVTMSQVSAASRHLTSFPWGGYHLGFSSSADSEPGRCRRTDGKKWRCTRDVVPDQKYCERHMHRGRNRSRKLSENQTSSQAVSVTAATSSAASSVGLTVARGSTGPGGILPSMSANAQQSRPISNVGIKSYVPAGGSGGMSVGSSVRDSQYQAPLPSTGGPTFPAKDFRYLNGITKSELDLGPEQLFFSEATGSARGMDHDLHAMNGLSMLSSVNNNWRPLSPKGRPGSEAKNSSSILQYSSPQIRSMLGQDFGVLSDSNSVNMSLAPQQQQHSFLGAGFGTVEAVTAGREPEGQPLRHFFDDWPRSRDPSALSWSDVDDERSNRSSSTTQLSISIPLATSDFTATGHTSPRGKLSLSPLKLSMARAGEDDSLGVDATQMGLGVGMGLGINEDRHRHTNWIPIAWETPVGGPLAEVLQSSTPRGCKSSGLNLMTDGWESSPRDSPRMASPADTQGAGAVARSGAAVLEPSKSMD